jgi:hypothetical protein
MFTATVRSNLVYTLDDKDHHKEKIDKRIFENRRIKTDKDDIRYWEAYIQERSNSKFQFLNESISLESVIENTQVQHLLDKKYLDRARKRIKFTNERPLIEFFLIKNGWEGFMQRGSKQIDWEWKRYILRCPTCRVPKSRYFHCQPYSSRCDKNHREWQYFETLIIPVLHDFSNGGSVSFLELIDGKVKEFDANDALIAVQYDEILRKCKLIARFQLLNFAWSRDFADEGIWTEKKKDGKVIARTLGKNWNNKIAYVASPASYDYPGISVFDEDYYFSDIHGYIGSHGCIQICPFDQDFESPEMEKDDPWHKFCEDNLYKEDDTEQKKNRRGVAIGIMRTIDY